MAWGSFGWALIIDGFYDFYDFYCFYIFLSVAYLSMTEIDFYVSESFVDLYLFLEDLLLIDLISGSSLGVIPSQLKLWELKELINIPLPRTGETDWLLIKSGFLIWVHEKCASYGLSTIAHQNLRFIKPLTSIELLPLPTNTL